MVEDDIAIQNLFICCTAFRRPRHKSGPCRTFVFKYIYLLSAKINRQITIKTNRARVFILAHDTHFDKHFTGVVITWRQRWPIKTTSHEQLPVIGV